MPRSLSVVVVLALAITYGLRSDERVSLAEELPNSPSPVVVELFTSQGCSSCPPADQLLSGLADIGKKHQLPIICLSFHVDYWNSLGWKDPYSSKQFTRRQHQYAQAFESQRVYTPQMIVNGATEFVGSRGRDAQQAIQAGLATPQTTTITVKPTLATSTSDINVEYHVANNRPGAVLNVALVQHSATNEVPRGENAGRSLAHVHVVRQLKTVPLDKVTGTVKLALPDGLSADKISIVAYVQDPRTMQIAGAQTSRLQTQSSGG